jgi:hypothetical protein
MEGFFPFFGVVDEEGRHRFSCYGGARVAFDYLAGNKLPLHVLQSFGGRYPETGLGGAVRGSDPGRYGTRVKVVGNLELRGNLPSILWEDLVPGVLLYFDAGYYNDLDERFSGPLFSTGVGVFLDLFGLGELVVYSQCVINKKNVDGSHFTPVNINFGFHF